MAFVQSGELGSVIQLEDEIPGGTTDKSKHKHKCTTENGPNYIPPQVTLAHRPPAASNLDTNRG